MDPGTLARAGVCLLLGVGCATPRARPTTLTAVPARDSTAATKPVSPPRFYLGRDFGSERQFNPLSQIVNEGFDILRANNRNRHVLRRNYDVAVRNVWNSTANFDRTLRAYGVRRAWRNEFLPLSGKDDRGGGTWVANYQLHLFGAGMVSVRMEEWFAQHGVPHPALAATATLMASHFANEIVENDDWPTPTLDPATDLLIFDPLGILLWRIDAVQRAFSGPLELTSWAGQPSFDVNNETLENAGQDYVLRGRLPGTRSWRFLYILGMKNMGGLTYATTSGSNWSMALGPYAEENPVVDSLTGARTARLRLSAGLFYDRAGSLMFSAVFLKQSNVARLTVNAYPGLLKFRGAEPGVWLIVPPGGGVRIGLASRLGIGLGAGPAR